MAVKRHSLELFFDERTEAVLQGELHRLRDAGLPSPLLHWGMRPHISLLLGTERSDGAEEAVAAFAAKWKPLPVTLCVLATFPGPQGTALLLPVVTRELLELHASVHSELGPYFGESDPHYAPDSWVPHCTLSIFLEPEELEATLSHLRTVPLPIPGELTSIGIHASTIDPDCNGLGRVGATDYPAVFELGS